MGIISAVGRANMGIVDYENFIQTDAAINPGNSAERLSISMVNSLGSIRPSFHGPGDTWESDLPFPAIW